MVSATLGKQSTEDRGHENSLSGGCALAWALATGCATYHDSNTARTPQEQLLLSKASELSIAGLDLGRAAGRRVFLDATSLECVAKVYVLDALRQALAAGRATVVDTVDDADMIVAVRSGMLATRRDREARRHPQCC